MTGGSAEGRRTYALLVVDDEESIRKLVVKTFERKGFKVFSADGGAAGLEILRENRVDLVISDLRMQGGDGLWLLDKIRTLEPRPPVIMVTAFPDMTEAEAHRKGISELLLKPFTFQQLFKAAGDALGIEIR